MTSAAKIPTVGGASLLDMLHNADRDGVLHVDPKGSASSVTFDQTCFKAADHASEFRDERAMLILSTDCDGIVRSKYDGEASEVVIRPGTFHFVPGGIVQFYEFKGVTTNIFMTIAPEFIDDLREHNPEMSDIRLDEPMRGFTDARLASLVIQQNKLVRSGEMGWRTLADANMMQLGVELMRICSTRRARPTPALDRKEVALADAYLRSHLEQNMQLSDIAELLGRDVFGFSRAFKIATGTTFHRYSLQLRVDEAVRMLRQTTMPIAEIAFATGFSSQAHMTTTMRRIIGRTPGAVRKAT